MKRDLAFKVIFTIIILISCISLSISLPFLIKFINSDGNEVFDPSFHLKSEVYSIFVGAFLGIAIVVFSLLRLESDKQIKLARVLLIISTLFTAMFYIVIKSNY